jgi:hypothetical protein
MNSNNLRGGAQAALLAMLLALSGSAAAQQAAGRFLIAVGTVTVERGAERIAAATGTEVRKGDTIQVAAGSNAQLRFSDSSVVALRPGTTMRVTEYSYQQAGEKDGTAIDLLKGGLRTVTGLLGRSNRDEYKVNTPTATIGIRGTHYVLRVCDDDCDETTGTAQAVRIYLADAGAAASDAGPIAQAAPSPAAARAPNGTYGTVSEGRISVSNQSGERQFGADQVFHVASRTAAPQQLIAPPAFLRDRLDGRGRGERRSGQSQSGSGGAGGSGAQQQQQGEQPQSGGSQQGGQAAAAPSSSPSSSGGGESVPTLAPTGQGAGAGDARVSGSVTSPVVSLAITPTLTQVTNQAATAPASILELTGSSANLIYRLASTSLNIPFQCVGTCTNITAADLIVQVNPTSQTARIVLAFRLADGGQVNINNGYGDFPVSIVGNQLVINGAANSADYPTSQGSFRCSDCGPGDTPGFLTRTEYTVTISGGQATLTVKIYDAFGNATFTATLPQVTSTFTATAAVAGRNFGTNGGASAYVQLNGSGQPVYIGEPLGIGNNLTSIGSGTNQTIGGNASAGNLVWGTWTGQATGVNGSYAPFTQSAGSVSPWIVGELTNVLPASLGTATFTPVGSVVGNGGATTGSLSSAQLTANFVARSVAFNATALSAPGGGTYTMNGSASFSATNGRFSAGFNSVTCSGSCISGPYLNNSGFTGFFAGANAAGAGVAFNVSNGVNLGVVGVVGFKKQ